MKRILTAFLIAALILGAVGPSAMAEVVIIEGDNGAEWMFGGETELTRGEKVKVDGKYSITYERGFCFADEMIFAGRYLGVLTSKENGATVERYGFPIGTHTAGCVVTTMTNRSKQNINWLKRFGTGRSR